MKSRTSSVIGSVLSPLLVALLLQGCAAPGDPGDELPGRSEEESQAIDEYVDELGKLEVQDPISETNEIQPEQPSVSPAGTSLLCSVQETREIRLFEDFASQGGVAKRIYPGAMLDGNSVKNGVFSEIPLPKKPLTVSIDLPQQTTSAVMEDPSLSSFLDARQELVFAGIAERPEGTVVPPKFVSVDRLATSNEDQLSLELGFDVSAGVVTNVDVAGQFNFNDTNKRSRYLLRIVNELYTVAVDKPSSASDFLADSVSLSDIQDAFKNGNPPVYVDTITYGRVIYIGVESSFSATELDAALQVAVDGAALDAELEFGVSASEILQETTVRTVGLGLAQGDQVDLGSIEGLDDLEAINRIATREASVNGQFFGEPVSFTLTYLTDNTQTISSVEGTYTEENCRVAPVEPEETTANFRVDVNQLNLTNIQDSGSSPNTAEMRGTIEVSFGGQSVFLFNKAPGQEVVLLEGPTSGTNPSFLSGTLNNVDITPGSEVTVRFNLVENDVTNADDVHSKTEPIAIEDVLAGEGTFEFNFGDGTDGTLSGSLRIGFQQL